MNFLVSIFFDKSNKSICKINQFKANISDYSLSPNERKIALKTEEAGADSIKIYELKENKILGEGERISLPPGIIQNFSWRDNEVVGFDFNSIKSPTSIKSYSTKTKKIQDWTKTDADDELNDKIDDVKLIKWKSFDEQEITGYLLKPKLASQQKIPVLIDIHGGPLAIKKPDFDGYSSFLANTLSVAIIFPNIRGSTGFGSKFENLDDGNKRINAVKDLQKLLQWIKAQPNLDSKNIVVHGASYGGLMAIALALREQDKLKAVSAEIPLISIKSYLNNLSPNVRSLQVHEFGDLQNQQDMENNEKLSILYGDNIHNWKIPLLLVAGQNDVRAPSADVDTLNEKLKERNIPVTYLKATKSGHSFNDYNLYMYMKLSEYTFLKENLNKKKEK